MTTESQDNENDSRSSTTHAPAPSRLLGRSVAIQRIREQIATLATVDLCLLVTGETGVGKQLVAREVHRLAVEHGRRTGPLVIVDGPSLVGPDAETRLLGCGSALAVDRQPAQMGLLERGHRGTVFIDRVDELPPSLQAALARAIESREITPVGARGSVPLDIRIIASAAPVGPRDRGSIRDDLYYRIAEQTIEVPPLRRRPEDIRVLAEHALAELDPTRAFSTTAMSALERCSWSGNVRELESVVRRAALTTDTPIIGPEHLLDHEPTHLSEDAPLGQLLDRDWEHAKDDFGRWYWTNIWHKLHGDKQRIAEHTGVSQVWLRNRRKIYELPDAEALGSN